MDLVSLYEHQAS